MSTKLKLILLMLLPLMNLGVKELRDKDDNSTGLDDIIADQLETAVSNINKYTSS